MEQIPHMKNYFGDIDDELTTTLVSVEIYKNVCEELKSEYEHYSDAFTNFILLVLTLVTFVFLPINIYTSFFGMNFVELESLTNDSSSFSISILIILLVTSLLAYKAFKYALIAN